MGQGITATEVTGGVVQWHISKRPGFKSKRRNDGLEVEVRSSESTYCWSRFYSGWTVQ